MARRDGYRENQKDIVPKTVPCFDKPAAQVSGEIESKEHAGGRGERRDKT